MKPHLLLTGLVLIATLIACGPLNKHAQEVEQGRYLVEIMGCHGCHTPDYLSQGDRVAKADWLTGDDLGYHGSWGTAYPTNLRLLLASLSEEQWLAKAKQMRQDSPMAWSRLPKASDADLLAIYRFVRDLGPAGQPAPAGLPAGVTPKTDFIEFPSPH